jgi:hypothetical protein
MLSPLPISGGEITDSMKGGAKRRGVPVKTLKKLLKKAGLKTSGKKAALTRRAKKARLMKGGDSNTPPVIVDDALSKANDIKEEIKVDDAVDKGGRKRRKSRGFKLY